MFFFFSKVLDYVLLPFLWIVVLLIFAYITKSQKARRKSILVSILLLFFFGNGFIQNEARFLWQIDPVPISRLGGYEYAIVLAGIVPYEEAGLNDRVRIGQGADRLLHAVQLYKQGKIRKVLISGGSGTLVGDKSSEAVKLRRIFMLCGVEEEDILIESTSRSTYESALLTKELMETRGIKNKFLLITSAVRMRRAQATFSKAGIKTDPFVVDFSTHGEFYFDMLIPSELAISSWTELIREIVGYSAYRAMGYI